VHEAIFYRLDDSFLGQKTPTQRHTVDEVLQKAELGPTASSYVGLTFINLAISKNLSLSRIIKKNDLSVRPKSFS
jgi:hypothetical protein